jgi:hypothetical protein
MSMSSLMAPASAEGAAARCRGRGERTSDRAHEARLGPRGPSGRRSRESHPRDRQCIRAGHDVGDLRVDDCVHCTTGVVVQRFKTLEELKAFVEAL